MEEGPVNEESGQPRERARSTIPSSADENLARLPSMTRPDEQQSTAIDYSTPDLSSIYPLWSSILPDIIKGLLFPPLAGYYRRQYSRHNNPSDLFKSIRYAFASLATTSRSHSSLPFYKLRLAQDLKSRYGISNNAIDLVLALLLQRTAIEALPTTHPDINWHRQHLHEAYAKKFRKFGDVSDLDRLSQIEEAALRDLPPSSPKTLWWKSSRSFMYWLRYSKTGNPSDLDQQIEWAIGALDSLQPEDPSFPHRTSILASAYVNRFEHHYVMDDMVLALFWGHQSLEGQSSADIAEHAVRQQVLATVYDNRSQFLGLTSDLEKALELTQHSIQNIPAYHSVALDAQVNLGTRNMNLGKRIRSVQHLDKAILLYSRVLPKFTKTSPTGAICAGNLSTAYVSRYNLQLSNLGDLESGVEYGLRCVQVLGDANPKSGIFQNQLSSTFFQRYIRHRDKKDLEAAIHWSESSLRLKATNKQLLQRQSHLANLLLALYRHTGSVDHLDESHALLKKVVDAVPPSDEDAAEFYIDFGSVFAALYDLRGGVDNRDAIIHWNTKAVQVASPDNPRLKVYKYQLGLQCYNRYSRLRDEEDLNRALKYTSDALTLAPPGDPMRASYSAALASIYTERHSLSHSQEDEHEAFSYYRISAQSPESNPSFIWDAVNRWARFAEDMEQAQECLDAYNTAFKILPQLFWLGSDIKSRHEALVAFGVDKATGQAVAGCIRYKHLPLAVELLEQSLSMTFQELLGLQTDLGQLMDQYPSYASLLESLSTKIRNMTLSEDSSQMQQASSSSSALPHVMTANSSEASNMQGKLVVERTELLQKIRELPGFDTFLLPTPFEKPRASADQGPVIILNTVNQRLHPCDALILLPGGSISHVVLYNVTLGEVTKQIGALKRALKANGIHTRRVEDLEELSRAGRVRPIQKQSGDVVFQRLLDWIWTNIVSKVFDVLHENGITQGRIWWCPTGPFTHLPLHAAGPPSDYIQSYTSNLGSLLRARASPGVMDTRVTAIGLSDFGSKAVAPLPSVLLEISSIKQEIGENRTVTLINSEATLTNTVDALSKASWLHLACHGEQGDPQEPLKSRIILYNDDYLDLQTIIRTSTPSAEFVFLSACETATGDTDMTNESLHLAGGMLFAGFKAAIGTLWSINDADGPVVAQSVYSRLFEAGKVPTALQTAEALHFAIRDLRQRGVSVHRWAPFIHIGI